MKNTAMGMPEENFRALWLKILWLAMMSTGKGYRRDRLGRNVRGSGGWTGARRADKVGMFGSKVARHLQKPAVHA